MAGHHLQICQRGVAQAKQMHSHGHAMARAWPHCRVLQQMSDAGHSAGPAVADRKHAPFDATRFHRDDDGGEIRKRNGVQSRREGKACFMGKSAFGAGISNPHAARARRVTCLSRQWATNLATSSIWSAFSRGSQRLS